MAAGPGMTNAEIADRLCRGNATIRTHVSNLLTMLDLHTLVQAVVAYESGLVWSGTPKVMAHPGDGLEGMVAPELCG